MKTICMKSQTLFSEKLFQNVICWNLYLLLESAMRAASQLPGRGPTNVMLPLYLHINQKSGDDDDDDC